MDRPFTHRGKVVEGVHQRCNDQCPEDGCKSLSDELLPATEKAPRTLRGMCDEGDDRESVGARTGKRNRADL
jgi:hypothetical protein